MRVVMAEDPEVDPAGTNNLKEEQVPNAGKRQTAILVPFCDLIASIIACI